MKRLAILFSGGDSQGMNVVLSTFITICLNHNIKPIGIRYGYKGLLKNDMIELTKQDAENITDQGGCFLKVARCPEFYDPKYIKKAANILAKREIDGLIVVGGDGSYHGAIDLSNLGVKVAAIPGTIDNDLYYTEKCLGFDTAVNNAVGAIDKIRQTMDANDRVFVAEVMGRKCGHIALNVAVAEMAHSLAVLETGTRVSDIIEDVKKCIKQGVQAPIVIMSEGCTFELQDVEKAIKQLGLECRTQVLGYIQRGGAPTVMDRMLGVTYTTNAVENLIEGKTGLAVGIANNEIISVPIKDAVIAPNTFNMTLYNELRTLHNLN